MREKEREKRFLKWKMEQKTKAEHEKLKRKKIEDYERRRAEELAKVRTSSGRSRSRRNSSSGSNSLFKGPEDTPKISAEELKLIKVTIHRNVPAPITSEIRYEVSIPEDVIVKRRDGEGYKPIFDREELKNTVTEPVEVKEQRIITAVGENNSAKRLYSKRRSASLSPPRHRSPSPRARSRSPSYRSRHYSHTRDNSREDTRRRRSPRPKSYSRERDHHKSDRDSSRSSRSGKDREHRSRSKYRSYDRRDRRDTYREHFPFTQYVEPMHFPVYYGGSVAGPSLIRPSMPPIRPPMGPGRIHTMPIRGLHPPGFMLPDAYGSIHRLRPPMNFYH